MLTLALGLGASAAIFSALQAMVLRPLPIANETRVVTGIALREGFDPFGTSLLEYEAIRDRSQSVAVVGVGRQRSFTLSGQGAPERIAGASITSSYFAALGVEPFLGRGFAVHEDVSGGPAIALIGHGLWQRRFGGDPSLVGRDLDLDGRRHVVIGILPVGVDLPYAAEIWTPLQLDMAAMALRDRAAHAYELVGRLRPGTTVQQADQEARGLAARLGAEAPQVQGGWSYRLVPVRRFLAGDLDGRVGRALSILTISVALLLVICCVNVAGVLLALGVTRRHEIGLRLALGATRGRLARQVVTESVVLGCAGGALGLLVALWIVPALAALSPLEVLSLQSFFRDFRVDWRVVLFAGLVSLLTATAVGSIVAVRTTWSVNLREVTTQRDRQLGGGLRLRRGFGLLIVGEVALAATLLVSGSLLMRSFQKLSAVELGFSPDRVLTFQLSLDSSRYSTQEEKSVYMDRISTRVRSLPEVRFAGLTTNVPLQHLSLDAVYVVEGRDGERPADLPITAHRLVTAGYLETLGVTLTKGRLLEASDRAGTLPVVVVSESLARQAWPGQDPLGRRVRRRTPADVASPWLTVVGVVRDVKEDRFGFRSDRPVWYVPYEQQPRLPIEPPLFLALKSTGDPARLAASARAAIQEIDPTVAISTVTPLATLVDEVLARERFSAVIVGALASAGVLLVAVGLYGVVAFSVSQRTAEMGVRIVLGAGRVDILKLVMGRAIALGVFGVTIGLSGARMLAALMADMLYDVVPGDPMTFAIVGGVMIAVALVASYVPARRAMRTDPIVAIRQP